MHVREIPFLRLFVPLCAGVIVGELLPRFAVAAGITALAAFVVMTWRLSRKEFFSDTLFGLMLSLFIFSAGYLLRLNDLRRCDHLEESRRTVTVRLSEYPHKKNASFSFRAAIISVAGSDGITAPRGSLLLYFISDTLPSRWQPGDQLQLHLTPRMIRNSGNPCEFNYRRYMEGRGIRYTGFFRARDIAGHMPATRLTVRERSQRTAHALITLFAEAGLHDEGLGVVTALTLGDRDLLDREHLEAFARSGVMHIMAVSGLHVGMISMALSWMLFFLRGRLKPLRAVITVPLLWVFAFITGLSPSVLRATIMFTFLQAGTLTRRPPSSMNSLLASAFIMTAARPAVLFEAGFQLSYLAVAFIILFYSRFSGLVRPGNRVIRYVWQVTALSLVAQAGTMALTVRLFNIFPLLFPLSNILVVPITFLVLMLVLMLIVTSPVPFLSSFTALLLDRLAGLMLRITGTIGSVDRAVLGDIGFTAAETVLLTVAIALLLTSLLRVYRITLKPFIVAALLFAACNTFKISRESNKEGPVTYNIRGNELKAWQQGRMLIVTPSDGTLPAEVRKHAAIRGLKIEVIEPG
ncbi:MAG: ComEC/Rec2 family competence protein [Bacteroidales bacterium]|nr:ComEC/Rec2 family competence protein [Bacteroidales bacterium]